jgi:predicted lipoprotein
MKIWGPPLQGGLLLGGVRMRRTLHISVFLLSSLVALGGCKIVKNPDPGAAGQAQEAQTDQARMAALAREIWEPKVLPAVAALLAPLDDVRAALAQDVDAAGAKYGYKPVGEASAWNFGVTGTGVIVETKMKSRAAKLQVDTVGDGKADVTIQLGPIIRGTALRDAMSFLSFSDFRDQIEFAKLAGALNAMAHENLTIPTEDPIGKTVTFSGIYTFKDVETRPEIVPTDLSFGAP